jgi:hypothetical protein
MRTSRKYSVIKIPPISEERLSEIEAIKDENIDFSDISRQTKEDFSRGHFVYADVLKLPKKDTHRTVMQERPVTSTY